MTRLERFANRCGWVGSICLAFCGLPEALRALSAEAYNISFAFTGLWFAGEVFLFVPAVLVIKKPYVIFNITMNIIFIGIMLLRVFDVIGKLV